jgi:hypothetical protein
VEGLLEAGAMGAAVRGGRLCGVLLEAGLWTALMADGVDGADGSVGVLLDGLHSCRW